jgi:hypothetical protein
MRVDLIVENGRIRTGDPVTPVVDAVGFKGRLVPGQLADMVFLEEHPADVAVEEIGTIPVLATVAGGVFTHRQSGFLETRNRALRPVRLTGAEPVRRKVRG